MGKSYYDNMDDYNAVHAIPNYNPDVPGLQSICKVEGSVHGEPNLIEVTLYRDSGKDHIDGTYFHYIIGSSHAIRAYLIKQQDKAKQSKLDRVKMDGNRKYVSISFDKKDQFKAAHSNARWDGKRKMWYLDNPTEEQIFSNQTNITF